MYNQTTYQLGSKRSTIREIFEYAKREAEKSAKKTFLIFPSEILPYPRLPLSTRRLNGS